MKKIASILFFALMVAACSQKTGTNESFSSFDRAKLHAMTTSRPAIDFFEGAVLGNGGMGVIVTTRPDAIVMYFGHNNVWDIRIAENHREEIGTFEYVFNKVKSIPDTLSLLTQDPWYRQYSALSQDNYRKPYPRPFPCGTVLLGFDRRNAELIGHKLDISNGLCEVTLLTKDQQNLRLQVFTDMARDRLWMRLIDSAGNLCQNIFDRVRIMADPSTPEEFPKYDAREGLAGGLLAFRQVLPYEEPDRYDVDKGHPQDEAFRLVAATNSELIKTTRIDWNGNIKEMAELEASFTNREDFVAYVALEQGLNTAVQREVTATMQPANGVFMESLDRSTEIWREYWSKSGIELEDEFLERTWYHNLYFFNCAAREGVRCPGLFANWSYNRIGTAWHGDYHMNYNTQQPFWMTFSSNHLEKNLPYVSLIEFLMPVSTRWAEEYYHLPGAYFPHSAYPVEMTMNPYPVPTWGWEICETPWSVQGLWWHYLYSGDVEFLRTRAYAPIKAAVEFLVAYMQRPEARGPQWNDDRYHIFPTVPPELYGLRPGFKYNYDCTVDLTLVKFIYKAFQDAAKILDREDDEKELLASISDILNHFPEYPTAVSEKYGKIFVSVPGEHDQVVYNVPNALITVFPGEDHGMHSDEETFEILRNTFNNQQNEGGNELVFMNLQAARLGMLDLEKFKRQVNYCLLPNGTAADMVLQVHGRYSDRSDYGFMDDMGIWFENFALPVVVNECLMQSYNGTIRLFPNWPMDKDAEFHQLRAAGAFLVSSKLKDGKVTGIDILSEAGAPLNIMLPWAEGGTMENADGRKRIDKALVQVPTEKGEQISFRP